MGFRSMGFKSMGFLDFFRRPEPIRNAEELADFIDKHAAFVVQKGIYEYSRARAGHYSKVLFKEPEFQAACDVSRWRAFPIGLAMVAEVTEGLLRPHAAGDEHRQREALVALVLAVFDRYPVPAAVGEAAWRDLRAELERRLKLIGFHAPKWAKDVPEQFAQSYFDLMPIHEKLRGRDFGTTRNYLRVTMTNVHDELTNRLDAPATAKSLISGLVAAN
jgi:hypothetical protein